MAGIYCCRRSAGLRPGVFATVWTVPGRRPALRHAITNPLLLRLEKELKKLWNEAFLLLRWWGQR